MRKAAIAVLAVLAMIAGSAQSDAQQTAASVSPPAPAKGDPGARRSPRPANLGRTDQPWRLGDPNDRTPRMLSFFNARTRQSISITYRRDGAYVREELDRLDFFLRDSRNGSRVALDPRLYDVLWMVGRRLRSTASWHVLSAYRSPSTNAWLASAHGGVASDSLHMRGMAIDVMLPGHSVERIRAAVLALGLGGIGAYPQSGFVHIDTGAVRQW